ncbi:uncharacterized protein [Penaeus vannamei]|uniref:uncharacterized protein n=1 Tax=Penaeus vannamei TaxID=6689 RepID=UPI000F678F2C|nr:uncharacterized protein LOC113826519 [Penaeus vannamei]
MCRVAALFVTVVLAVASAAPDAGYVIPTPPTPPCNPKTEYITKYKEKVQQVPVKHTVFKTNLVPTTVLQTDYSEVHSVLVKPHFVPQYITTTRTIQQVQRVTKHDRLTSTLLKTNVVTKHEVKPTVVRETVFDTVVKVQPEVSTITKVQTVPQYVPTTVVDYRVITSTKAIPEIITQVSTYIDYVTVCPRRGY